MIQISVIIPAYRARNFISSALDSVLRQTLREWELIIVDDASPESIEDIVETFAGSAPQRPVRLIKHETNLGLGGARNSGITAANGVHIAFLDHDDIWLPNHLELVLNKLSTSGADVAFSTVEMFDSESGKVLGPWAPTQAEVDDFRGALFRRCFIAPSAVVMRKEAIVQAGLFDTSPPMHYVEDFDLWLRMLEMGFEFTHLPKTTCRYRKHSMSATQQLGLMEMGLAEVRYRHMREPGLPEAETRRVVVGAYGYATKMLWKSKRRKSAFHALLKGGAVQLRIRK